MARALWEEDVREMKILATLVFPPQEMTHDEARRWVAAIPYPEIAEQCSNNLFPLMAQADGFAVSLLSDTQSPFARTVAFLVFAQLFKRRNLPVSRTAVEIFFAESHCTLQPEEQPEASWTEKRATVQALRFFGRLSPENARAVLDEVSAESPSDELREFYDELKFEFETVFPDESFS